MIKEYAIDPAIAGDFSNLKQIANLFDFSNPRRISRFPRKWERMVYEAAVPIGDMNTKRVVEKIKQLKEIKSCLHSFGRSYHPEKGWLENALEAHSGRPFSAIVCESDAASCVNPDGLEDTHPLIQSFNSKQVMKNLADYRALFDNIFTSVKNIYIVDPYFSTYEQKGTPLYSHWFSLLNSCSAAEAITLSIVTSARSNGPYKIGDESNLISRARQIYAGGHNLKFAFKAKIVPHDDDMHDRFVLTDYASFSISSSLVIDNGKTMMIHMLTKDISDNLFSRFST